MTKPFELTPRQKEVRKLLGKSQTHTLIYGGSRSGKTFLLEYAKAVRAIRSPGSRHLMSRFRNVDVRQSVFQDTFPKMMRLAFPEVSYEANKQDQVIFLPNGSELWYAGLDDKDRVEKILGKEYATIVVNEASQVSYPTIETLRTRLAQSAVLDSGKMLPLRAYYDLNPSGSTHWTYQEFIVGKKPTGEKLLDPKDFAYAVMNPSENPHLQEAYLKQLEGLSSLQKRRFLHGEYLTTVPGSLWTTEMVGDALAKETLKPDRLSRIVVSVDPSGSDGSNGDSQGIIVAGVDRAGHAHVLEDASMRGSPSEWAATVISLYDSYRADKIIAEKNFGGEMVRSTIQMTAQRQLPVKLIHASRGKHIRAEPVAALYEQGRVSHEADFKKLADQMTQMTSEGYSGSGSPDRVDALVWALTELGLAKRQSVVRVRTPGAV